MKKTKNILLITGSLALCTLPVFAIVSCSSDSDKGNNNNEQQKPEVPEKPEVKPEFKDFTKIKNTELNAKTFGLRGTAKNNLSNINSAFFDNLSLDLKKELLDGKFDPNIKFEITNVNKIDKIKVQLNLNFKSGWYNNEGNLIDSPRQEQPFTITINYFDYEVTSFKSELNARELGDIFINNDSFAFMKLQENAKSSLIRDIIYNYLIFNKGDILSAQGEYNLSANDSSSITDFRIEAKDNQNNIKAKFKITQGHWYDRDGIVNDRNSEEFTITINNIRTIFLNGKDSVNQINLATNGFWDRENNNSNQQFNQAKEKLINSFSQNTGGAFEFLERNWNELINISKNDLSENFVNKDRINTIDGWSQEAGKKITLRIKIKGIINSRFPDADSTALGVKKISECNSVEDFETVIQFSIVF